MRFRIGQSKAVTDPDRGPGDTVRTGGSGTTVPTEGDTFLFPVGNGPVHPPADPDAVGEHPKKIPGKSRRSLAVFPGNNRDKKKIKEISAVQGFLSRSVLTVFSGMFPSALYV